ncbi:MAG: elongation factor 4 [Candidatus Omnitrophica bacterium]|nr:elongation factor 4 [Candidatus Omnitrophota bacterium]
MDTSRIRNFCIIAHIDHGKSTLADRMMQFTGAITEREFKNQLLDDMDLEREHGITIKASAVRLHYKAKDKNEYLLNLIDTPGHVDFTYEVSKSIRACEGAILLVDAAQGVEAQTVANLHMAKEHNLAIVPVINKIDLQNANPDKVKLQIMHLLDVEEDDIILISAKEGVGTEGVLEKIIDKVPAPSGDPKKALQALVFDSQYNSYKGVMVYIKVVNGNILPKTRIRMMQGGGDFEVLEQGIFKPDMAKVSSLKCGEVGYLAANIRDPKDIITGDTVTDARHPAKEALPGYKKAKQMVYSGIYPVNTKDFESLRDAIDKLRLSDASFVSEAESSASMGFGFRCGFLGLLHMQIIQERLEREYNLDLVMTTPSVVYRVEKTNGEIVDIENPTKMPGQERIAEISEPFVTATMIIPADSLGNIMELSKQRRGVYTSTEYLSPDTVDIIYDFPLSEIIVDFYDKLKSLTRGYGSLDYEFKGYKPNSLVKLDILLNGEPCDALSLIVFKEKAEIRGRAIAQKLKELIPKQLYEVAIQAAIGNNIIARETVGALKKNVTGKCYGGDITRKRKLWEKQKQGKKRLKQFGKVQVPQEAFLSILKI